MHRRLEELQGTAPVFKDGFRRLMVSGDIKNLPDLTPREREVPFLLVNGMSRKDCAATCGISPHTVSDYTKSIYHKLGVRNVVEAARAANMV
ncbi:helix-turn-helix domain-containing protein [Marimonas arenosa]|uniref:Helix-turn-helix transcriptional regulator n=1 Tax=Marimonas arenosa TaxID=1795305 RepID=A0AAE4B6K0_9RHOB|nr:helix-turn-helix transcriptional regulator [Marimonas arenosa]MDQ2092390.1 helix-turn-helix transcriptional regulator [Marimonas arenosa]